jgi:NodT family efflux transporter outer membrane factor (OMF) lipoprotein
MLGPDFVKPDSQVAGEWLEADNPKVKSDSTESREWWTAFKDPVLNALVQKSYQQNLPLRIAGLRILAARARLGIAIGNLYPQQQRITAEASKVRLSENAPNSRLIDHSHGNYLIGFDAAWELDFWGRFRRGIESADAQLVAFVANYDDILVSLTAEVARTYVLIRTFQERIEIAEDNVRIQQRSLEIADVRSLEIADVRFRNGLVTELDVTQAKTLLRNTQASVPRLQIGLRQAKNALSVLLAIPPSHLQEVLTGPELIPTPPTEVAVGIPADLLRRRPDIRRAELVAAAQSARIGVARTDLFPRIAILGMVGLQSSSNGEVIAKDAKFTDLFKGDSLTYFIGPTVEWPILNYGRLKNNVRVQDARFQQLIVNYKNRVLEAAKEVEDGLIGFLRSQDEVRYLLDSVEASKRSVELSLIQYRDGAVSYQRVLDSQQSLVDQQDLWTATRGDVALNLVATYKALGGGWQIREGKEFIPVQTQQVMAERTDWGDLLSPAALEVPPPGEAAQIFPLRMPDF